MRNQNYIGRRMLVFDDLAWAQAGYDHPDGNESFWRPATIEAVQYMRNRPDDLAADVRWDHNGRRSVGHFVSMMKEIPEGSLPNHLGVGAPGGWA